METERLQLRPFTMDDVPDVFAYAANPKVGPMAGWPPHKSLDDTRLVVEHFIKASDVWAVVEKSSGHVIGTVGLHVDTKRDVRDVLMLGYAFGEPSRGKGYAVEAARAVLDYAFGELQCALVSVYHFAHNLRSRRVIEKLGFVPEGTLRMASTLPDESIVDDVCYSMTREEFVLHKGGAVCRR